MTPPPASPNNNRRQHRKGQMRLLVPFLLFIVFAVLALIRIITVEDDPASTLASTLVGRSAPHTVLPPLGTDGESFNPQAFHKRVTLVNFWGSWCPPCRQEHPVLMRLAQEGTFDLAGVNFKDRRENALRFLGVFGNPFRTIGYDPNGKAAIDWGVYGPPETFVIGKDGVVLYRHIGPLTYDIFNSKIRPLIEKANSDKQ